MAQRLVGRLDGSAAPGRDRHVGLLGEPLGGDLVADEAHHRRIGADEDDAEPLAQLRELGVLGDEAPPDPRRVGAGLLERALQRAVVQVGAASRAVASRDRAGIQAERLVGVTDEHRVTLGLGVERDQADRLGALLVELAHGVDDTHGGLAAIDDRQA